MEKTQTAENIVFAFKKAFCFISVVWIRYDCQPSGVLAAKLNAYGLETSAVRLMFGYLTKKTDCITKTKTDCHHSSQRHRQQCRKHLTWRTLL